MGPLLVTGILFFFNSYRISFAVLAVPAVLALILLVVTWTVYRDPQPLQKRSVDPSAQKLPRAFWWLTASVGSSLARGFLPATAQPWGFKGWPH